MSGPGAAFGAWLGAFLRSAHTGEKYNDPPTVSDKKKEAHPKKKTCRAFFFGPRAYPGESLSGRARAYPGRKELIREEESLSGVGESLSGSQISSRGPGAYPGGPQSLSGASRRREPIRCDAAPNCENDQTLPCENCFPTELIRAKAGAFAE